MDASVLDPTMKVSATDGLCHHCTGAAKVGRGVGHSGRLDRFHELVARRRRKIPLMSLVALRVCAQWVAMGPPVSPGLPRSRFWFSQHPL